jgi:hypothetical protein
MKNVLIASLQLLFVITEAKFLLLEELIPNLVQDERIREKVKSRAIDFT